MLVEGMDERMQRYFAEGAVLCSSDQRCSLFSISAVPIPSSWSFKKQSIWGLFFCLILFYLRGILILIIITIIIITIHIIIILKTLNRLLLIPHDKELELIRWLHSIAVNCFQSPTAVSSQSQLRLALKTNRRLALTIFIQMRKKKEKKILELNQSSFWHSLFRGKMCFTVPQHYKHQISKNVSI